jgi:hypothetical protein
MWLTLAARLIESLDDVHGEVEAARRTLRDGATRRARERARGTMRKLERQTARLRASLAHCERRVAALATGPTESGQVDPLAAVRQAVAEANQP